MILYKLSISIDNRVAEVTFNPSTYKHVTRVSKQKYCLVISTRNGAKINFLHKQLSLSFTIIYLYIFQLINRMFHLKLGSNQTHKIERSATISYTSMHTLRNYYISITTIIILCCCGEVFLSISAPYTSFTSTIYKTNKKIRIDGHYATRLTCNLV